MITTVKGETPFKALKECFEIGPSSDGYTLQYSVDRETWTSWTEATPANENCIVNSAVPYSWFRLKGNGANTEVTIIL